MKEARLLTAPKKTWGGQCYPQVSFSLATFRFGGKVIAPKCPTFLSCKPLAFSGRQKNRAMFFSESF